MDHYNDLVSGRLMASRVRTSSTVTTDARSPLAAPKGAYIEQEFNHVISRISAQAKEGGDVQQAGFSLGSLGDYDLVKDLDEKVIDAANRAVGFALREGAYWVVRGER